MDYKNAPALDPLSPESLLELNSLARNEGMQVRFMAFDTSVEIKAYGEKTQAETALLKVVKSC